MNRVFLEAELLYKPLCPSVGRSVVFWAFRPNYLQDLYESWQIYKGEDVEDHKPLVRRLVGRLVSWSG